MQVKPGYKQTEVGVIPESWEIVPIGSLLTDFRGGAPLKPSDFTNTGVKVLPKGGVGRTGWLKIEDKDLQYCSPQYATAHRRNQVDETFTIVVLRDLVPSGPSIGLMVQVREREIFVLAQGVYGLKVSASTVPGYLVQLSNTRWYRKLANSKMVGSTQVHITNTAFKGVRIPQPPVAEQQVIAEALSDADALIESIQQLVAKKRAIKQGAMQELLSGKKRLPGFNGQWKRKKLGEIAHIKTGSRNNQDKVEDGAYPFFVRSADVERINSYSHTCEAILVPGEGNIGSIFHYINGRFDVHQRVYAITQFSPDAYGRYVYLYMVMNFGAHAMENSVKATVDSLRLPTFENFDVILPPTIGEQIAIAAILSDMDAEIEKLTAKLTKAREIKQAMMQELLTGRIRLI